MCPVQRTPQPPPPKKKEPFPSSPFLACVAADAGNDAPGLQEVQGQAQGRPGTDDLQHHIRALPPRGLPAVGGGRWGGEGMGEGSADRNADRSISPGMRCRPCCPRRPSTTPTPPLPDRDDGIALGAVHRGRTQPAREGQPAGHAVDGQHGAHSGEAPGGGCGQQADWPAAYHGHHHACAWGRDGGEEWLQAWTT